MSWLYLQRIYVVCILSQAPGTGKRSAGRGDDRQEVLVVINRPQLYGILQVIRSQVRIAHGHGQSGVAQDLLQGQNIPAVHHEPTREGVSQHMR